MSFPQSILEALEASRHGGVRLAGGAGEGRRSYGELAARARRLAGGLAAAGVGRGDRALLVLPTGQAFVDAFFGCSLAGTIPCQLSPPEGFGSARAFRARLAGLARQVGAACAIAEAQLHAAIAEAAPELRLLDPTELVTAPEVPPVRPAPADPAFVQFTSGTTRTPRGVVVSQKALAANTEQIGRATGMRSEETVVVSWLPMFHDMGLVGWLVSLFNDTEVVLSPPRSFLRRPVSWLRTISEWRGTHSPAPTFAYGYAASRVRDRELEGLDLSSWRTAFVGAEPIPADVLRTFAARFAPYGLAPETLLPCYGMAEATLALTFCPDDWPWNSVLVSRRALQAGHARPPDGEDDALEVVSCGVPLDPTEVWVEDAAGHRLGDDEVGEVWVRGPSLFSGYWGEAPRDPTAPFATGDLGFVRKGELYVAGRKKDLLILRGENHHPEEVEWAAARVPGVRMGRCAAFTVPDPATGDERLCLLVEAERRALLAPAELEVAIRRRVHEECGLAVEDLRLVGPGGVPVTTSGKVRRAAARARFLGEEPE
ncbi:MAG: fatty acyl-AMP ligase [Planctomycetota bacterium]|nr:MAG: fatty acyl-AMP ligase [Planctomycetota bacterium]